MAVEEKAMKRRRTNNNLRSVEQTNDRLSSLHDDLLIVIISCLPLRSAVVTGLLSRRWRGLWNNISSIIISDRTVRKSIYNFVFSDVFLNLMMQIKSPFIHRFHLEFEGSVLNTDGQPPGYSWLRRICDWNVRELKLTWPYFSGKFKLRLPSYIFQTRSLVSIELDSIFDWELPNDADPIILPNLKNLSLHFRYFNCECLEKLIKSCLSLEELSLKCIDSWENDYLKCSNQNLRRLFINWRSGSKSKIVINAPKLEYLNVCAPLAAVVCLEEEPIALREAKLQISESYHPLEDEKKKLMSKFYEAISSVGWITVDAAALGCISTVFHNVTRLTLNMESYLDTNLLLSLLKLCPVLDVFTLKLGELWSTRHKPWLKLPSQSRRSSSLRRVLKTVEVEIHRCDYWRPSKPFLELVGFLLLSGYINSEHFHFRFAGVKYRQNESIVESIKRMEIDLCRIFDQAPMVSKRRYEVEFVGEYFKLSRNSSRKFSRANREIIHFSCSP